MTLRHPDPLDDPVGFIKSLPASVFDVLYTHRKANLTREEKRSNAIIYYRVFSKPLNEEAEHILDNLKRAIEPELEAYYRTNGYEELDQTYIKLAYPDPMMRPEDFINHLPLEVLQEYNQCEFTPGESRKFAIQRILDLQVENYTVFCNHVQALLSMLEEHLKKRTHPDE